MEQPLILITNDDGIDSAGLWAAAEAVQDLGEIWVVAPNRQWSGAGRSMPQGVTGAFSLSNRPPAKQCIAVDASPAVCVVHAMLEWVDRKPALVISGINFGVNISTEVTISGTIGAALEAAAFRIPSLAVSMQMDIAHHLSGNDGEDYAAAKAFTRKFAQKLLTQALPGDASILSINIPEDAQPDTPWRLTRLSRTRYFIPLAPRRDLDEGRPGYQITPDVYHTEVDSDIWCLHKEHYVSVSPLSMDLTARIDFAMLDEQLRTEF